MTQNNTKNNTKNNTHKNQKPKDNMLKGILFMLGFTIFAPVMDAVAKILTEELPVAQIVWARFFMHMLLTIPLALYYNKNELLHPHKPKTQIARSILLMTATLCFFTAIKFMAIADALALAFISPFIVTALSGLILGEKVGMRRYLAVIVGFIGIIIILQPTSGVFSFYSIFAIATGVVYAFYVMFTRKMAGSDPPLVTLSYTSITGAILMSTYLLISNDWQFPTSNLNWTLLIAIGFWAMLSHLCLIRAFDYASASSLSPFLYCEIIMATILGYLIFGDFPSITTWAGMTIVVGSGVYISWREHILEKRKFFKERR